MTNEEKNKYSDWKTGKFVDSYQYRHVTQIQKDQWRYAESKCVESDTEKLCICSTPEDAQWVAERLNLAASIDNKKGSSEFKIFKIDTDHRHDFDYYDSFIIVARNEAEVLDMAQQKDPQNSDWDIERVELISYYTGDKTEPFILSSSYNAG